MERKVCSQCVDKTPKPIEDFAFKNKRTNRRNSACRKCTSLATSSHYANNKDYYKSKAKIHDKIARIDALQYIVDYFKTHPCIDCSEPDPIVLEFDHLRDKYKNVSRLVSNCASLNLIKLEIEKCEVRCANCHRRKTAKQFGWYKDIKFN